MERTQVKEVTELRSLARGHVLYFFEDYDRYLSNVEDFVITGLKLNEYAVMIENDRWVRKIRNKLCESLEERYLQKVAFINNFDFYYAKGDFRVNSIFDFLPKVLDNYSEENSVIRSWAHVEWRNEEEFQGKLLASEEAADGIVSDSKILSVCAYDSDRASQEFKAGLLANHNYLLLDQKE